MKYVSESVISGSVWDYGRGDYLRGKWCGEKIVGEVKRKGKIASLENDKIDWKKEENDIVRIWWERVIRWEMESNKWNVDDVSQGMMRENMKMEWQLVSQY